MIGVFGQREMELAAIRIVDERRSRDWRVAESIFRDDIERAGYWYLCAYGWVDNGIPTPAFWERVQGK